MTTYPYKGTELSEEQQIEQIAEHYKKIMEILGLDLADDSLQKTPHRVAKMFVKETLYGLREENSPKMMVMENKMQYDHMLVERNIKCHSLCLPGTEKVISSTGYKKANAVREGDELFTLVNGIPKLTKVTKITTHKAEKITTIKLSNGKQFKLTPDHPVMTENGWVEAGDLQAGNKVEQVNTKTLHKKQYPMKLSSSLGYFIGAVASDGSIQDDRRICVEVNEKWFAKKIRDAAKIAFGIEKEVEEITKPSGFLGKNIKQYRYRIVSSQIAKRMLKMLKLEEGNGSTSKTEKFKVPELCYISEEFRQGFLEGYIDGDGCNKGNGGFAIVSKNTAFMEELATMLGAKHSIDTRGMSHIYWVSKEKLGLPNYKKYESTTWEDKHGFELETEYTTGMEESTLMEVVDVYIEEKPTKVYSIQTEDGTFLVKGVLTHNCEHHWQPIIGYAHIAYIPKYKVIGLSKLNRIVDFYSRKPQVQERLTQEIHDKLVKELGTEDVAVVIDAEHMCVKLRGIQDQNSSTVTSKLSGNFKNPEVRQEFFNIIQK